MTTKNWLKLCTLVSFVENKMTTRTSRSQSTSERNQPLQTGFASFLTNVEDDGTVTYFWWDHPNRLLSCPLFFESDFYCAEEGIYSQNGRNAGVELQVSHGLRCLRSWPWCPSKFLIDYDFPMMPFSAKFPCPFKMFKDEISGQMHP